MPMPFAHFSIGFDYFVFLIFQCSLYTQEISQHVSSYLVQNTFSAWFLRLLTITCEVHILIAILQEMKAQVG